MPLIASSSKSKVDVTVFIPTFNGEKYLDRLLTAVESQDYKGSFEILVIDSGSTDKTQEIISSHPAVRLVEIKPQDFGHGKTRNLAASLARGRYIAYLSHDAVPMGVHWLENLVSPLDSSGLNCVGVVGKHIPRPTCQPLLKYGIQGVFRACGPDSEVTVIDGSIKKVEEMTDGELFYSDVNSATRKDFLLNIIPYQDVDYSEDLAFARDFLREGYKKAYVPLAQVEHSNDVTFREFGKRVFDEIFGMRKIGQGRLSLSIFQAVIRAMRDILKFSWMILTDSDYSFGKKLSLLGSNIGYCVSKWVNMHRALNVDFRDTTRIARYSLEAQRALAN